MLNYDEVMQIMEEFEEEAPPTRKRMCGECPFRRDSTPGHLGPHTAEEWASAAHGEGPMACHSTIVESESWVGTQQCAGMAQFRTNICKRPRHPLIETAAEPDRVNVFAWDNEMVEHHNS